MLVYKYTSSFAGRLIIENGSVRFSQIEVLNDPFELKPSFDLYKKSVREFARRNLELLTFDFKRMSHIEQEHWVQKISKPTYEDLTATLKSFLVLSLTKKEENLLMWSHYADSHRGLVIGFDYDNIFFKGFKPNISVPFEVNYSKTRPAFFDYGRIRARNVSMEEIRDLLLMKSHWWEYEEEVRLFAEPSAASNFNKDDIKKDNNGFDIYLFDFPKECLKQIIFGSLINPDKKKEISELAKNLYPHIELLEAVPDETEFALKFKHYKD